MTRPLHIDFVSDIACPWCAVGLHALDTALARLGDTLPVRLHFQPFELNPALGPQGDDATAYLMRKYGLDAAQVAHNQATIRERGAAVGFRFGPRMRVWNTFDAHRLLHWAGLQDAPAGEEGQAPEHPAGAAQLQFQGQGQSHQHRLKHALLQAYHGDGENVSDAAVLCRLAAASGLDADAAAAVLASGAHAQDVRAAEARWQQLGIRSVPAVVVEHRHLIQGGQPPEVFERALREIAEGPARST